MTESFNAKLQGAPEPQVRVSVIVPVYNRSEDLQTCLSAILRQVRGWEDCEILICDDGST
jgi:glycosyltransferase involved in cell wall biosynthesis